MKKLLVLFILFTLLLSGCGLYNLDSFVLPDDAEFLALIQELDTPYKIGQYMKNNFSYKPHPHISLTPYQLYITRKGDCNDLSTFAIFISNWHGYETYQIEIFYKNTTDTHMLAVYKENNIYSYSDNQHYYIKSYDNFPTIVKVNSGLKYSYYGYIWSSYTVYDYNMNIVEKGINN